MATATGRDDSLAAERVRGRVLSRMGRARVSCCVWAGTYFDDLQSVARAWSSAGARSPSPTAGKCRSILWAIASERALSWSPLSTSVLKRGSRTSSASLSASPADAPRSPGGDTAYHYKLAHVRSLGPRVPGDTACSARRDLHGLVHLDHHRH